MYQHENCRALANLYTCYMYQKISQYQRARYSSSRTPVVPNSWLCSKIKLWLEIRSRMNGTSWYDSAHHTLATPGAGRRIIVELGGSCTRNSWLR